MSALPPITDFRQRGLHVRLVPEADIIARRDWATADVANCATRHPIHADHFPAILLFECILVGAQKYFKVKARRSAYLKWRGRSH